MWVISPFMYLITHTYCLFQTVLHPKMFWYINCTIFEWKAKQESEVITMKKKKKGKILVVDKDTESLEIMIEYLDANGYEIEVSQNYIDAQQKIVHNLISENPFDIGIVSYDLDEDYTGIDFVSMNMDKNIDFIGISEHSNKRFTFFEAGASAFLTKPINFLLLTKTILTLMEVREKIYKLIFV